jgi:hypothetical protein
MVAAVAVSAIITFFVFSILQDMRDDLARSRRYNNVINEAFELSILVDSFGEGSSQRDMKQVNDVRKTFSELLANLSSSDVREDYLIRQIRRNNQELGPLLDQFFDQREVLGSDLETERKNMLASQLWIKARFITDDTHRLIEINQSRMVAALYWGILHFSLRKSAKCGQPESTMPTEHWLLKTATSSGYGSALMTIMRK